MVIEHPVDGGAHHDGLELVDAVHIGEQAREKTGLLVRKQVFGNRGDCRMLCDFTQRLHGFFVVIRDYIL